jgi:hypothetical protein
MITTRRNMLAMAGAPFAVATASRLARAQQIPAPTSAADIPGTPYGTIMPKDYVATVARNAYLWGWPLVNQMNRRATFAKAPEPGRLGGVLPVAPTGYVSMLTDYIAADERFVTCPNQDTVYGAGFMALDRQPVIVQVPDFGGRFYTYQLVDHRTDSFYSIGKQYNTKPGFYLLVGPNWNGTLPDGIAGVGKSSTDLVAIFPRVFQDDTPEDKAAIQGLLRQIMVYPLAEFDGQMKTKDWSKVPSFPAPAGAGQGETKWVIPEKFFDQLPEVLQTVPALPGEEAMYGQFRSLLDAAAKDPQIKATLTETAMAAEGELIKPLFDFHNNGQPVGNGWTSPPNNARWGTDYLSRTATARSNMFDNAPNETKYIYTDFDVEGQRLTGAHRYSVTFASGRTPSVNGFLVADGLQQGAPFRTEPTQPLLARHQKQVDEDECRRIAHLVFSERDARRRKGDELGTDTHGRVLPLHPGVLAER